jgi:multidrug efflux pump subunit AcrB
LIEQEAGQIGLTQRDVANSLLISRSSSGQTAPNFWLNPVNGVNYSVAVQTPQMRVDSFDALQQTPVSSPSGSATQLLSNLATLQRGTTTALVSHYNVQPVFDIYANVDQRDLGSVAREVQKILQEITPRLPKGASLTLRGQAATMQASFVRLGLGILFAIVLVYLLMVVNFQSWLDPFIILMALPGALVGILWILFVTQTTFNVPSLMGAIMSIEVATANSILLVTFANDERRAGKDERDAAFLAGVTRLRPVLMTALAMIIGMLPMALGLGEGGGDAPLGRERSVALAATLTTFLCSDCLQHLRKTPPVDLDAGLRKKESALELVFSGTIVIVCLVCRDVEKRERWIFMVEITKNFTLPSLTRCKTREGRSGKGPKGYVLVT